MGEKMMPPIEVRFDKNIRNLTLVREADTRRQWEYVAVAMLGAMFVLGLLIYGTQLFQYQQYGYQIHEEQNRQRQLEKQQGTLLLFREKLQDPERIQLIARRMGMVQSVPGQLVTINLESSNVSNPQLSAKK
jgi:membrane protein YdbS with pleckstrin-like domain